MQSIKYTISSIRQKALSAKVVSGLISKQQSYLERATVLIADIARQ